MGAEAGTFSRREFLQSISRGVAVLALNQAQGPSCTVIEIDKGVKRVVVPEGPYKADWPYLCVNGKWIPENELNNPTITPQDTKPSITWIPKVAGLSMIALAVALKALDHRINKNR